MNGIMEELNKLMMITLKNSILILQLIKEYLLIFKKKRITLSFDPTVDNNTRAKI